MSTKTTIKKDPEMETEEKVIEEKAVEGIEEKSSADAKAMADKSADAIVADKAAGVETMADKEEKEVKKTVAHKTTAKTAVKPIAPKKDKYYEAVGRRKEASARVRLFTKNKEILVNNRTLADYFPVLRFQKEALSPLDKMKIADKLGVTAKVQGGGIMAQSEAIRLGIARALIKFNPVFKKRLRKLGLLTRDPRAVERKKYGLKKARRAPQWTKR